MKIELGKTYEDKITGFTGVAIGHVEYITGCNQTLVQPKCEDNSKQPDAMWKDDSRLVCLDVEAVTLEEELKEEPPGFDISPPTI